jgi:Flp pilus assembly protein TadG
MPAITTRSTSSRKSTHTSHDQFATSVRSENGQATVEFAFASVVLFAFLIGIMQVSRALYVYNFVSEAAREASRYAAVRGSTSCVNTPHLSGCNLYQSSQIQTYVQGLNYPGLVSSSLTATVSYYTASTSSSNEPSASNPTTWSACTGTCNLPGNLLKVVVSYPFALSIPFYSGASITVSSTSQMVVAQ